MLATPRPAVGTGGRADVRSIVPGVAAMAIMQAGIFGVVFSLIRYKTGGVLRRLPLQWSTSRNEFFPYWNYQEKSEPSVADLWAQMTVLNSAWNLFCARCHTTSTFSAVSRLITAPAGRFMPLWRTAAAAGLSPGSAESSRITSGRWTM